MAMRAGRHRVAMLMLAVGVRGTGNVTSTNQPPLCPAILRTLNATGTVLDG